MNKLITKSCEEIMTTVYKPIGSAVDGLIAQGLYILAGSPKAGKSWLALQLCLAVAKGEKLFERETNGGTALYFCLEDGYERIQKRLYELTDEPSENLYFSILADSIGCGLEEQITKFKSVHEDLHLVVIDTLQMVRSETDSTYGSDYAELLPLKALAQQLGISIVLVHHLRKAADKDPFNMISGTTGIRGCVDGAIVLIMKDEYTHTVTLHAEGRDIVNRKMELQLEKESQRWKVLADDLVEPEKFDDEVVTAIAAVMKQELSFLDTATVLTEKVNKLTKKEYEPRMVSRIMTQNRTRLEDLGILFEQRHSNGKRMLSVEYIESRDDSDDRITEGTSETIDPVENALPA